VQKTAGLLTDDAGRRAQDKGLQSAMHYALGMASLAAGKADEARAHWAQCSSGDSLCDAAIAANTPRPAVQRASADATPAAKTALLRDPLFLYLHARRP